ncbi:hypothetical protein [Castellaniella sp. UC4442_H9]
MAPKTKDTVIADPADTAQVPEQAQANLAVDQSAQVLPGIVDPAVAVTDQTTGQAPKGESDPVDRIECAVRMDCIYGRHDDIITLTRDEARAAEVGGYVDTHPNAIAAIRGA